VTLIRKILPWLFIIFLSALLIIGFAIKDSMNSYLSKMMISQAGSDIEKSGSAYVDSLFNYSENGSTFRFTFLEFGAKGCSACKRMEGVMTEIKEKTPEVFNVVFIDISKPGNQHLIKYFGIASIPTQVLLDKRGREFFRHMGYYSAKELSEKLTSD
jgi:thioredoxin 1